MIVQMRNFVPLWELNNISRKPLCDVTICLAKNIYFEARSSSFADQAAVADVVMNRVTSASNRPFPICRIPFDVDIFNILGKLFVLFPELLEVVSQHGLRALARRHLRAAVSRWSRAAEGGHQGES